MKNASEQTITCPECGKVHTVIKYDRIIGDETPELKEKLMKSELCISECPECGLKLPLIYPFLYQDREKGFMVWHVPQFEKEQMAKILEFNETGIEDGVYRDIGEYTLRIVNSLDRLVEKILIFDEEMDDRVIEVQKVMLVTQIQEKVKNDPIRGLFFEKLKEGYGFTVLYTKREPQLFKADMGQYYRIYTRHKNLLEKHTKKGFVVIDKQYGLEMFSKAMREEMKGKGKNKGKKKF